jgi:MazG family protein
MPLPIPSEDLPPLQRLREVVHCLRAPGGCPWDQEQTHESLIPHLIEEAYEVAEAIRSGDPRQMADELGDLLLQPVLHAEIASETGAFDLDEVARMISDKLIRRHPHVFGEASASDSEAVLRQWDEIKRAEKGSTVNQVPSALDGVTRGLPALMYAQKIQKKAAKVGFDWPEASPALEKVKEEADELLAALKTGAQAELEHEVGDLLFSAVNVARKLGLDAEAMLSTATERFSRRFRAVEQALAENGTGIENASLEEMDASWERVKKQEN